MRDQLALEPGSKEVGSPRRSRGTLGRVVLTLIAAAAYLTGHSSGDTDEYQTLRGASREAIGTGKHRSSPHTGIRQPVGTDSFGASTGRDRGAAASVPDGQRGGGDLGADGLRPPDRPGHRRELQLRPCRRGDLKQRAGELRRAREVLEVELRTYEAAHQLERPGHRNDILAVRAHEPADVFEGFAGEANISKLAPKYQLNALAPADSIYGWHLETDAGIKAWNQTLKQQQPLLTAVGFPCTDFCILNVNVNYRDRPEELAARQAAIRPMLINIVDSLMEVHRRGRFFLLENPPTSQLWKEPSVERLANLPGVITGIGHMCQYGMKSPEGEFLKKPMRFMTNHPDLLAAVTRRCPGDHDHRTIQGKLTRDSQTYPPEFAKAVLQFVREQARIRDPMRFLSRPVRRAFRRVAESNRRENTIWKTDGGTEVFYLDASTDPGTWGSILEAASKVVESQGSAGWVVPQDHEVYRKIRSAVPWDLKRVQVYKLPKARREMSDLAWTHRGCAQLRTDGSITVETEARDQTTFPRRRFTSPVRLAIFFYGMAPEEETAGVPDAATAGEAGQADQEAEPEDHLPDDPESPEAEVSFPGLEPGSCPKSVQRAVRRLHINCGHPSNRDLVRFICAQGEVKPATLAAARALKCKSCARREQPTRHRPSKIPAEYLGQFGERVLGDFFWVRDAAGHNHQIYGLICDSTLLHQCRRASSRTPEETLRLCQSMWFNPYGLPELMILDQDGAYGGAFQAFTDDVGMELRMAAAESHHQIGRIERHNAVWRHVAQKLIDNFAVTDEIGMDMIITAVNHAKNSMTMQYGRSAYQAAFGRVPRAPAELLSSETGLISGENASRRERLLRIEQLRAEAVKALAEWQVNDHVRRGILRKTVHPRPSAAHLEEGQRCAFWREGGKGKPGSKSKAGGYSLGTFCGWDKGSDGRAEGANAWVRSAGRLLLVSREQLRPAFGFEQWVPDKDTIDELRHAEKDLAEGEYQDAREAGPPGDEPEQAEVEQERGGQEAAQEHEVPVYPMGFPHVPAEPVRDEDPERPAGEKLPDRQPPELPLPPAVEVPDDVPAPQVRGGRVREHLLDDVPLTIRQNEGVKRAAEQPLDDERSGPPQPFAQSDVEEATDEIDDGATEIMQDLPEVLQAELDAKQYDKDNDCSDEDLNTFRSRKEQKALDREIPWREILKMPEGMRTAYEEAAEKEYNNWLTWRPVNELAPEEARKVLRDPRYRKRVLRARMCYRDKNTGVPPLRAKARNVVIGCSDPDLANLERHSPTPSRVSFMLVVQIYASGKLDPRGPWKLLGSDATAAFLQGESGQRSERLFMLPPNDPISKARGCFPGELYEIIGNVYGLANAPLEWSREVIKRMTALGFVQHSADSMLFYKLENGELVAVGIFHVDDLIFTCAARYDMTKLHESFKWGDIKYAPETITFCGREVHDQSDRVIIRQPTYIRNTESKKVSSHRASGEPRLSPEEITELKSCSGALQWIAGQSRPDVAAGTSLAKKSDEELTITELKKVYELIDYARATDQAGICVRALPLSFDETIVVSYADSSYANAPGGKSQGGYLVCLAERQALTGNGAGSMLDWRSGRVKRVVRSTLAAEACSADAGVDHGFFVNCCLGEILGAHRAVDQKPPFEHYHATDCKSLFDAVVKNTSSLEEKRTLLDIRAIREAIASWCIRWVPTDQQWADGLTKDTPDLRRRFTEWLQDPQVRLHE